MGLLPTAAAAAAEAETGAPQKQHHDDGGERQPLLLLRNSSNGGSGSGSGRLQPARDVLWLALAGLLLVAAACVGLPGGVEWSAAAAKAAIRLRATGGAGAAAASDPTPPPPPPPPPPRMTPARAGETRRVCAAHAVDPPPPLPPALAAKAAPALALLRAVGTLKALELNKTAADFLLGLPRAQRERIAWETHTVALYTHAESPLLLAREEAAAMRAAPLADLAALNGLNLGAGGRPVHETLIQVDVHRDLAAPSAAALPATQRPPPGTLLAWADRLPFAAESIDYIVS